MAKKDKEKKEKTDMNEGGPDQARPMQRMPLFVHAQYIKDLSFENPKAPVALQAGQDQPAMDINFSMNARTLPGDNLFEVVLGVEARAVRQKEVLFLIELQYGAVVSLENVPEERAHPLLLIEVPRFLFPFVRQIVSDLTQQAGYAPLLLTPVNFKQMYMQRFAGKGEADLPEDEDRQVAGA